MLESKIEAAVCDYAKGKGLLVYKFTSPSRRAVPDRMFILPWGQVFFIEFKATGAKPTVPQEREHAKLRDQNSSVYFVDSIEDGKQVIDSFRVPDVFK
jgi:hypothetical protein